MGDVCVDAPRQAAPVNRHGGVGVGLAVFLRGVAFVLAAAVDLDAEVVGLRADRGVQGDEGGGEGVVADGADGGVVVDAEGGGLKIVVGGEGGVAGGGGEWGDFGVGEVFAGGGFPFF